VNTEALAHLPASDCANCNVPVSGKYCHECGQATALHPPSIGEFLHEFVGHYVALESKLWQTLKLLVLKPGKLTLEYLAGRRVRYIEPLRVYLTFSLIFFALFKFMGEDHNVGNVHVKGVPIIKEDPQDTARREQRGKALAAVKQGEQPTGAQAARAADAAGAANEGEPGGLEKFIDTVVDHRDKLKKAFFGYVPYAVFALMPVFALYLKLLYFRSHRRYGEHLLFALHANAFAYLMLTLLLLLPAFIPYVGTVLFLWLAFYLPIAMRRVYGGSRIKTFLRWVVLMCLHVLSMTAAISAVLYAVVTH
jgi:hypothetical protein